MLNLFIAEIVLVVLCVLLQLLRPRVRLHRLRIALCRKDDEFSVRIILTLRHRLQEGLIFLYDFVEGPSSCFEVWVSDESKS